MAGRACRHLHICSRIRNQIESLWIAHFSVLRGKLPRVPQAILLNGAFRLQGRLDAITITSVIRRARACSSRQSL